MRLDRLDQQDLAAEAAEVEDQRDLLAQLDHRVCRDRNLQSFL